MKREAYFRELVAGERRALGDRLLLAVLRGCALPYAAAMRLRADAYRRGLLPAHRLSRPVISVGNITVGGTGKTPMTTWLASYLLKRGKRVAVLSRGYGGTLEGETRLVSDGTTLLLTPQEAGDEPCLLARLVPGLVVAIGSDRYRAGLLAGERCNPDIFILDDGFQHLRLARDLNILLMDCRQPLGNGRTLPAGLLREPAAALSRADLAVFTRCQDSAPAGAPLPVAVPACRARHRLTGYAEGVAGAVRPLAELRGLRGMAIAGIADPAAFFAELTRAGLTLAATLPLPDHCRFAAADLQVIRELAASARADYLLMTAKDAVKLADREGLPARALVASLEMTLEDESPLLALVEKLL